MHNFTIKEKSQVFSAVCKEDLKSKDQLTLLLSNLAADSSWMNSKRYLCFSQKQSLNATKHPQRCSPCFREWNLNYINMNMQE